MKRAPGSRIIDLIAPLVPSISRAEWRAEWQAELAAAAAERPGSAMAMRLRSFGAIPDALWHRRHQQEPWAVSHHLRHAVRLLRRRPGFSAIVILTLALGLGGTTAIYSVVNAVLIRSLPYPKPEQLVTLTGVSITGSEAKVGSWNSYPDYLDYRRDMRAFSELAAYREPTVTLTMGGHEPRFIASAFTTANIFPMLAIQPALGRSYTADEEVPGAPGVALLSYDFWHGYFGSDPGVLGRVVQLDGEPHTIIGVLPAGFQFGGADLWAPLVPGALEKVRGAHRLQVYGRIRDGTTREAALRDARSVAAALEVQYPGDNAHRTVQLTGLHEAAAAQSRAFLLALMGGVMLVLLIVCANVANLFLVRAAGREREFAVRSALGAGRGTLLRQFLIESLVVTLIGALAGLPLAYWGVKALVSRAPAALPRLNEIGVDPAALGFMLLVTLVAGVVFGVVPAAWSARHSAGQRLRERGMGVRQGRLSRGFVVTQVALAAVLVIGASLLGKSLWRLSGVDLRFNPAHLLVARVQLPDARYLQTDKTLAFFEALQRKVEAEPGVKAVSVGYEHPLSEGWTSSFIISELEHPKPGEEPEARVRPVTPGYFQNMGMTIVRGRDLDPRADFNFPGEVVVNQAFVRQYLNGREPIGTHLLRNHWWPGQPQSYEIVGVVANERFRGLSEEPDPATYFPHRQFPMNQMYLLVRATGDAALLRTTVRNDIWSLDRDLALQDMPTMDDIVSSLTAPARFNLGLIGLFALVALLLASLGVYGVLAQMVTQRTAEIGIRVALGADRGAVVRLVVGQGLRLSVIGAAAGLLLATGATRVLQSQLYAVETRDPVVFAGVAVALVVTAVLAAYLPARRAAGIDPIRALKEE